ncbi:transposase [Mycolicibacterium boenickei]
MAAQLSAEAQADRVLQRRLRDGELQSTGIGPTTIRNWLRAWQDRGLRGLVDGRSIRERQGWNVIEPRYRELAEEVLSTLDGNRSVVSQVEIDRRVRVRLAEEGVLEAAKIPQRASSRYISNLLKAKGDNTRAHRSAKLQEACGIEHYPADRPGQVVAIDVTRADNLVFDSLSGKPVSVEIITVIDVATRVVLALRVVPRSANGIEAGLMLYDTCRPLSCFVEGTDVSDWRWCGLPEQFDASEVSVSFGRGPFAPTFSTLQGQHRIPSVNPAAVRCDRGSIFVSEWFCALLRDLRIDLLLSRPHRPTDNPHVERWHETIQRALQQIPGYKGRCVAERGRLVAEEPLLMARELQLHLRRFVALDYHRTGHDGLVLPVPVPDPEAHKAKLCPLEMWDAMIEATGRIDVPQRFDLIYQFLPMKWLTIGDSGVEHRNLSYDSAAFDGYRNVPVGYFRPEDKAAPFHIDPHDLSRIWFRHPETDRVEPIDWKGASRTLAPLTDTVVKAAARRIRARGGNGVLKRGNATRQITEELGELTVAPSDKERAQLVAAKLRVEQSRVDHQEAQCAQDLVNPRRKALHCKGSARAQAELRGRWPDLLDR